MDVSGMEIRIESLLGGAEHATGGVLHRGDND